MAVFTINPNAFGSIQTGQPATGTWNFWNDAVNAPDGVVYQYPNQIFNTVVAQTITGRGTPQYRLSRVFAWFDLSAYAPNITSIEFEFEGLTVYTFPQFGILCKSFAFSNASSTILNPNDFQIGAGWDPGVTYSAFSPLGSSSFVIQGNAACVSAANAQGYINLALIQYDNDYNNVSPGTITVSKGGEIDLDPNLNFSNGVFSTGYANIVNGFSGANINNVNTISSADINVVIGM
jgi:hypothetical protein